MPHPAGLRPWRADDAEALAAAWVDPDIAAWNPVPAGLDAVTWIAGCDRRWERRLALDLVIERDGVVAGEVGLANLTATPHRAELGVWVAASHRRRGVAADAVQRVTDWALTTPVDWHADGALVVLDQLWARTHRDNHAAGRLFDGLGWRRLGEAAEHLVWGTSQPVLRWPEP